MFLSPKKNNAGRRKPGSYGYVSGIAYDDSFMGVYVSPKSLSCIKISTAFCMSTILNKVGFVFFLSDQKSTKDTGHLKNKKRSG